MGLDMYLTGIVKYDKTVKLEEEVKDLTDKLNKIGEEITKKFSTENKGYIDDFIDKYEKYLRDDVRDDVVRKVIVVATDNLMDDEDIGFYIFNMFPITIMDLTKEEKKEILKGFKDLVNRLILTDTSKKIEEIRNILSEIEKKREELDYYIRPVIYWRKANMIHGWFYRHFCDSEYKCLKGMYVDYDDLLELKKTCEKVVELITNTVDDPYNFILTEGEVFEEVNKLLPPMSGFFFGNTDIDDSYLNKVKFTIKEIDKIPENMFDKFKYEASW